MQKENKRHPGVGIGVILLKDDKILIGKRKGNYAPWYSIPGGHLEEGESFVETAIREVKEETGISIHQLEVIAVTNNLDTYKKEGIHHVSVILLTKDFTGEPQIMEPNKCEEWIWIDPNNLPQPHFDASEYAVKCYLEKKFHIPT